MSDGPIAWSPAGGRERGQALEDAALLAVPDLGHGAGGACAAGPLFVGDARAAATAPRFGDVDRSPATYVEVAGVVEATGHHLRRLVAVGCGGSRRARAPQSVANTARRYRRSDMRDLSLRGQGPVGRQATPASYGCQLTGRVRSTGCAPRTWTTRVGPSSVDAREPGSAACGRAAARPARSARPRRAARASRGGPWSSGSSLTPGRRRVGEQHVGGREARQHLAPPPPRSTRCRWRL